MKIISPFSTKLWAIDGFITSGIFVFILVIFNIFLELNDLWKYILTGSIYGISIIVLVCSLFIPKYKYEKFRYDIDEEKISLRYGVLKERNVIIPMSKGSICRY